MSVERILSPLQSVQMATTFGREFETRFHQQYVAFNGNPFTYKISRRYRNDKQIIKYANKENNHTADNCSYRKKHGLLH